MCVLAKGLRNVGVVEVRLRQFVVFGTLVTVPSLAVALGLLALL